MFVVDVMIHFNIKFLLLPLTTLAWILDNALPALMLRYESLVLYRIMYGNRVKEVQRRNTFVVGSCNTETISWDHGVCWDHGGIKLNKLIQGRNCFCFALEPDGDASLISFTPRFCHPRHRQA